MKHLHLTPIAASAKNHGALTFISVLGIYMFAVPQPGTAQEPVLKSVYKERITITPYMGFPNLLAAAVQNMYELTNQKKEQLSITGVGPLGIRAAYFITDHLSIGGEVSYASTSIQWKETRAIKLTDSTMVPYTYSFRLHAPRIRTLVKLNYHFAITEHREWYAGGGVGYNNTRIKLDTDAPYIRDYDILSLYFLPLSARLNLGFNYYFSQHVGLNAEVGLGGPLASVGLTVKF
jgi:hypothetical protein